MFNDDIISHHIITFCYAQTQTFCSIHPVLKVLQTAGVDHSQWLIDQKSQTSDPEQISVMRLSSIISLVLALNIKYTTDY